jgi:hypothetical protein
MATCTSCVDFGFDASENNYFIKTNNLENFLKKLQIYVKISLKFTAPTRQCFFGTSSIFARSVAFMGLCILIKKWTLKEIQSHTNLKQGQHTFISSMHFADTCAQSTRKVEWNLPKSIRYVPSSFWYWTLVFMLSLKYFYRTKKGLNISILLGHLPNINSSSATLTLGG